MFEAQQKSTGTRYTTTVALLAVAFIFIPTVWIVSRPFGYVFLCLAVVCSALCVILGWRFWKKFSQLSLTSIAIQEASTK
ncbi:MAG TPA: hypothetical protein VEV17_21455 [Bryobacteraceae bacterium]|nr:hypothetical protein [Bryobacteraceae bacterium]